MNLMRATGGKIMFCAQNPLKAIEWTTSLVTGQGVTLWNREEGEGGWRQT